MKKLTTLTLALFVAVGLTYAQNNASTIDQTGDNQTSTVNQVGTTNTSDIDQISTNTGPQVADVIQNGTGNISTISQTQSGGGNNTPANTAYIEQLGTGNISTQSQTAPGYNSGQYVWGYQDGTANILSQTISGGYSESLTSEQFGNENSATQSANGAHNHGEVYQDGSSNIAEQTLSGSNNGYSSGIVLISQLGTGNYAMQDLTGFGSSHFNNGEIYQDGMDNQAWQTASGRNLNAQLWQTNDGNWSSQMQTGEGHSSVVHQNGMGNTSTVTQSN